jgi:hypothetical protein
MTFIKYIQSQKVEKPNNLKGFGSKSTKEAEQDSLKEENPRF